MGCGCGGSQQQAAGANGYVHTAPNGTQTNLRTQIEAKAKTIREGGSWAPR